MSPTAPGPVVLLGSGETGPAGGSAYELLARRVPSPPRVAILETPAGFQPNSAQVAGKVAAFMAQRLRALRPEIAVLPARRRGGPESPDDPAITAPLCSADLIFLGAGSPTYAAAQLRDSRAWRRLVARHRRGAAVVTASAATIALGAHALPVYEIYKAGADLHWQPGLDLLGPYGLALAILPHWNNSEGGAELDTSRCFMGQARYERLRAMPPPDVAVLGVDEHTALVVDLAAGRAEVLGRGAVTVARGAEERRIARGEALDLRELGPFRLPDLAAGLPPEIWAELDAAAADAVQGAPPEVIALVEERQAARLRRDWPAADTLRRRLAERGWQVRDTPAGPVVEPLGSPGAG
jgi:hypothetical protein